MKTARMVALAMAVLAIGCANGSGAPNPNEARARTIDALCVNLDAALAGDLVAVRTGFDHGPLHEIASRVAHIDRGSAAVLLRAKQSVEAGLEDEASAPEVVLRFEALIAATVAALETLGDQPSAGCE